MANSEMTDFVNETQALEYFKGIGIPMSRPTFLQIRRSGVFRFRKVGGRYFYRVDSLRSFVNQTETHKGAKHYETI